MDNQGYVKMHRKSLESSVFINPIIWAVWSWCLMKANWKDNDFPFNGADLVVAMGSFVTGREIGASQCHISEQQWRTAIKYLKSTSRITTKSTNSFTIVTVYKWKDYQQDNQQDNQPITNQQPTNNQPITTNKKDKKDKKEIVKEKLTSKNSKTACTEEEIKDIAKKLQVSVVSVERTHNIILNKIATGEFKNKTVYLSLENWVIMGIERGNIQRINPINMLGANYKLQNKVI